MANPALMGLLSDGDDPRGGRVWGEGGGLSAIPNGERRGLL